MASARASAWRKPSESPSPVRASTDPEASPTSANRSRTTARISLDPETAPRTELVACAPLRRRRSSGKSSISSAVGPHGALAKTEIHTSLEVTGVTTACPRSCQWTSTKSVHGRARKCCRNPTLRRTLDGAGRKPAHRKTRDRRPSAATIHRHGTFRPPIRTPALLTPVTGSPQRVTTPTSSARSANIR